MWQFVGFMLAEARADESTDNLATHAVGLGPDGSHESTLYPIVNGSGNMGTVNIGTSGLCRKVG